ncbi:MAG: hypothetical protein FWE16_06065 [Firmicutes bacterium]|nr:hypothetical protein [Bacillota bacterium]
MAYNLHDLGKVLEKNAGIRTVDEKEAVKGKMAGFLCDTISFAHSTELQSIFLEAEEAYVNSFCDLKNTHGVVSDGEKNHLITEYAIMDAVIQNRINPKLTMFRGDLIDPRASEKGGVCDEKFSLFKSKQMFKEGKPCWEVVSEIDNLGSRLKHPGIGQEI